MIFIEMSELTECLKPTSDSTESVFGMQAIVSYIGNDRYQEQNQSEEWTLKNSNNL